MTISTKDEEWRPVVGYEGLYAVSNFGRIISFVKDSAGLPMKGIVIHKKGYVTALSVRLSRKGCRPVLEQIHRLVLRAFIGEAPKGTEGCHGDGDPTNNRLDNLRWDTHRANMEDCVRHGRRRIGSAHHKTTLTEDDIRGIRAEPRGIGVAKMLAKAFGVTLVTIYRIRRGEFWSHVPQYL